MAKTVLYCGVCGLPPEYCEYGTSFDKCIPWLQQNIPDIEKIYPQLKDESKPTVHKESKSSSTTTTTTTTTTNSKPATKRKPAAGKEGSEDEDDGSSASDEESWPENEEKAGPSEKKEGDGTKTVTTKKGKQQVEGDVKVLPGGKLKKKDPMTVTVARVQRNKRKYVTVVRGLENFGVKLGDASKAFSKKFSCGASVVKGSMGNDEIDVQGDVSDDLASFLESQFKVPFDVIVFDEGKKSQTVNNIYCRVSAICRIRDTIPRLYKTSV